jgi:enoyl-CoA hydratase
MAVDLTVIGNVGTISLNRAPANAVDMTTAEELLSVLSKIRNDKRIRAVVVRSAFPKFFSAGADIAMLRKSSHSEFFNFLNVANEVTDTITRIPKVFIAAIEGHCIGGGLEIALACDLRFASEGNYRIGLAEANLGLSPGMGGTQRLPRLISRSTALHLLVTGETVDPKQAYSYGMVDRLFAEEKFWAEVHAYSNALASKATMAQGLIKLSMNLGLEVGLEQGLSIERGHQSQLFATKDGVEGVKAFLEKRPPKFIGE